VLKRRFALPLLCSGLALALSDEGPVMSLARSASGPGGLTINTNAANTNTL
jgi:hypothetical protein